MVLLVFPVVLIDWSTIPFLLKSSKPSKTPSPSVSGLVGLVPNLASIALVKPSASGSKEALALSIEESFVQENRLKESAAIKDKGLKVFIIWLCVKMSSV